MSDDADMEYNCRPDLNTLYCPIWQCGGQLHCVDARYPLRMIQYYGENISWQIPDLVCDNCHSVYSCKTFERKAMDRGVLTFYLKMLILRILGLKHQVPQEN